MKRVLIFLLLLPLLGFASSDGGVLLDKPSFRINDHESLQRGAKYYMNYCSGCHSLKYIRYEQIAEGAGLVGSDGKALDKLVQNNLIFTGARLTDPVVNNLNQQQAKEWFGVIPPDLSLTARERGVSWLYTYLRSFYRDDERPLGANNLVFPAVGMPNVLESLQGIQVPITKDEELNVAGHHKKLPIIEQLELVESGTLTPMEFDRMVTDLVNFLSYVSEPAKLDRYRLGVWVLLFLLVFLILAYLLKQEFWRDIE